MDEGIFFQKPPSYIYKLYPPKTSGVKFESLFGNVSKETEGLLKRMTVSRDFIITSRKKKLFKESIRETSNYLSQLYGLADFLESHSNDKKSFYSYWSSSLGNVKNSKSIYIYDVYWEILFTLFNLAMDHRSVAASAIMQDLSNIDVAFSESSKSLCIAAGIFTFIGENVTSRYFVDTNTTVIPELFADTFVFLSNLCYAEVHELAAIKTLKDVKSLRSVGILCSTAVNYYQLCLCALRDIEKQAPKKGNINDSVFTYIEWKLTFYKALAHMYIAIDFEKKMEPGISVKHINEAHKLMHTIEIDSLMDNNLSALLEQMKSFKETIKSLNAEYTNNNIKVYHDHQSDVDLTIPQRSISKVIPFEKPNVADIGITLTSTSCCIQ